MGVNNIGNITHNNEENRYARNSINACRASGVNFTQILKDKNGELKFSAHAQTRMKSRNINMTGDMMSKLDKAVAGAEKKGSQDTLVLLSDLAFIVNIPNKTVITAMEGESIRENVFTNIDSTVIAG